MFSVYDYFQINWFFSNIFKESNELILRNCMNHVQILKKFNNFHFYQRSLFIYHSIIGLLKINSCLLS